MKNARQTRKSGDRALNTMDESEMERQSRGRSDRGTNRKRASIAKGDKASGEVQKQMTRKDEDEEEGQASKKKRKDKPKKYIRAKDDDKEETEKAEERIESKKI